MGLLRVCWELWPDVHADALLIQSLSMDFWRVPRGDPCMLLYSQLPCADIPIRIRQRIIHIERKQPVSSTISAAATYIAVVPVILPDAPVRGYSCVSTSSSPPDFSGGARACSRAPTDQCENDSAGDTTNANSPQAAPLAQLPPT